MIEDEKKDASQDADREVSQDEPKTQEPEAGPVNNNQPESNEKKEEKPKAPARRGRRPRRKPAKDEADNDAADNGEPAGEAKGKAPKTGKKTKKAKPKPAGKKKTAKDDAPVIKLLINAEEPEECRIAQLENGKVESFHINTVVREQTKNNIYKGKITAVEPSLQAAFVDIGIGKNGFLPFGEIHPEYYETNEAIPRHWKDLNIQNVIHKGQEVLVQVVKESTGNKGASMTTYLSLPGRFLVLMPGSDSSGISRKIAGEEQRGKLREMMNGFPIPEGIGYIVRTASIEITKTALGKDLRFLLRLWKEIKKRGQTMPAPSLVFTDQDIIAKFLRDHYTPDFQEIMVDSQEAYDQVNDFLDLLPAKQRQVKVKLHQAARPIFNQFEVEEQIEQVYQPMVHLPSGGSIVINPTEALVAIDVNSGRTSKDKNFAETIFLANMEAAVELARQLRLRDLGGLIVVDFIDMRSSRHIREVEKQVKVSMKRDKAKVDISRISRFGLMQISRQKMGPPIQLGSYNVCEHCQGRGVVRSVETQALIYLRKIQTGVTRKQVVRVGCRFPVEVAQYLLNNKRSELIELENKYEVSIRIEADPDMKPADNQMNFVKK